MDWGNTTEIIVAVLGTGILSAGATWFFSRKQQSLLLQKQEFEVESDIKEAYRLEANSLAQDVLRLEKKAFELERMLLSQEQKEHDLNEKYNRAASELNRLQRNSPLDYGDDT